MPVQAQQTPQARRLRAIRRALGLDQRTFAARVGVARRAMVSRYECGERRVPPWVLARAEQALREALARWRPTVSRGDLAQLTAPEAHVVRLRGHTGDGPQQSYAAIGRGLGLTRERVRQLERQAFAALRKRWPPPPVVTRLTGSAAE